MSKSKPNPRADERSYELVLEEPDPCQPPSYFIPSEGSYRVDITILGNFAEKPVPTVKFYHKNAHGAYAEDGKMVLDGSIGAQIGSILVPVRILSGNMPGRRYFTIVQGDCTIAKADIFELKAPRQS
jgi:hypothetical protein